ncbi:MAG: hypothetical protein FWG50_06600 [Kiritimatiellaeota bacterium]|nr:hypothetical protein [Kiritimatiellota bacterium]
MKKQELIIYSETVNCPVVQMPERKFPGIVLQGDSLKNLSDIVKSIAKRAQHIKNDELQGEIQDLGAILSCYLECYERTLEFNKIRLPYEQNQKD